MAITGSSIEHEAKEKGAAGRWYALDGLVEVEVVDQTPLEARENTDRASQDSGRPASEAGAILPTATHVTNRDSTAGLREGELRQHLYELR